MPVKRRVAKSGRTDLPPKCFAAFEADDEWALARALKLPPWHASPLDESLAGPAPLWAGNVLGNIAPGGVGNTLGNSRSDEAATRQS